LSCLALTETSYSDYRRTANGRRGTKREEKVAAKKHQKNVNMLVMATASAIAAKEKLMNAKKLRRKMPIGKKGKRNLTALKKPAGKMRQSAIES